MSRGSERLSKLGFFDQHEMLEKIVESYQKSAELIQADGIIPSGKMMMQAIDHGIGRMHRDTFHADLGIGRYLLSLTWYHTIIGKMPIKEYNEFDVEVSEEDRKIINGLLF